MRSKNRWSYFSDDIALDEATELPQEFYELLEKWKKQVKEVYDGDEISWYSKDVAITFVYKGKSYRLIAEDFYEDEIVDLSNKGKLHGGYLHAVVESLTSRIGNDLEKMGAVDIRRFGFLD
ncbi:MAG: hypothetical protein J6E38_07030 [Clostridia bacterium]|nr:hypothetical protein [Clostridia bacterium]